MNLLPPLLFPICNEFRTDICMVNLTQQLQWEGSNSVPREYLQSLEMFLVVIAVLMTSRAEVTDAANYSPIHRAALHIKKIIQFKLSIVQRLKNIIQTKIKYAKCNAVHYTCKSFCFSKCSKKKEEKIPIQLYFHFLLLAQTRNTDFFHSSLYIWSKAAFRRRFCQNNGEILFYVKLTGK